MKDTKPDPGAIVRRLSGCFIALFVLGASVAAAEPVDTVRLKDGRRLRGTVVELGGNRIELQIAGGAKRIHKREIEGVEFDGSRRQSAVGDSDVVIRQGGHRIAGKVEIADGGRVVRVTLPSGSTAEIPRKDVLKIIRRGEATAVDSTVYTAELAAAIDAALAALSASAPPAEKPAGGAPEFESPREAEALLARAGILAIQKVREALRAADPASEAGRALARVDRLYRLKQATAVEIEEADSGVYATLAEGSTEEKCNLLLFAFGRYPDESVPLAEFLALDPFQDSTVRGWSVEFLRKWRRNKELLEVYRRTTGKEQLAAAVALARNRILIGVPTLLEAMETDMPEIRRLANDQLVKASGKDLGYQPDGPVEARREALEKWREWWRANESAIQRASEALLKNESVETEERKVAMEMWREASADAARGGLKDAERKLRRALEVDPSFHRAAVGLAVLLYSRLDRPKEAVDLLESIQGDSSVWGGLADRESISLHLANGLCLLGEYERAVESYRRCLLANPENLDAAAGLGDAAFRLAVSRGDLPADERKRWLETASEAYRSALEIAEKRLASLVVLGPADLPEGFELVYDRREFNRSVLGLRERLRRRKFEVLLSAVRIRVVRNENEAALKDLRALVQEVAADSGKDSRAIEASARSLLGLLYEKLGRPLLAFQEYRKVLDDLDPGDRASREGIERLRRRVGSEPRQK